MEKFYLNKKVFVTGAGGFIGSHLVEELVRSGAKVTALVHYNSFSSIGNLKFVAPEILENVTIEYGDVSDGFQMNTLTKNQDVILHLAALIGIPYSYVAPAAYVSANILGTVNMLEAAKSNNLEKIVVTSTSETYGTAIYAPIDEKHPLQGQSPYSATKIGADKLAESYYTSFDLPVCTLRPFNTYGPRQSMRAVMPTIINQALYSDTIKLGSLSPFRDLLFAKDTARGFMAAGAVKESVGEVINVGTGEGVTIGELVDVVQKIIGSNKEVIEDTNRVRPEKSEVMKLLCNYDKAKKILDWKPTHSLKEGVELTINWIEKNKELFDSSKYRV